MGKTMKKKFFHQRARFHGSKHVPPVEFNSVVSCLSLCLRHWEMLVTISNIDGVVIGLCPLWAPQDFAVV